jgi:glycosyltransferase involved in cell wall biosynthesis
MRVIHIYRDCLSEGGVPHQTRRLVEAQARLGHEILTLSLQSQASTGSSERVATLSHVQVRNRLQGARALSHALKGFRPEVAHVSALAIPTHQIWVAVLKQLRIPYVVSPHGLLNPLGMNTRFGSKVPSRHRIWLKKAFFRLFDVPLLRGAGGLHAQADYERELLTSLGLNNIFTVPMGVDDDWIDKEAAGRRRLHAPTTFSYLGRIDTYHKGLDLVLAGFRELAHYGLHNEARLIIAGSDVGDSRNEVVRMIRKAGLTNVEVRNPAWGRDKKQLWEESDYFLSIFRYAGMARVTAEALGHGIPVIASREGNWGDWVRRYDMGFCVELDPRSVADLLHRIVLDERASYAARSSNALSFALSHSWQRVAAKMAAAYEQLRSRR